MNGAGGAPVDGAFGAGCGVTGAGGGVVVPGAGVVGVGAGVCGVTGVTGWVGTGGVRLPSVVFEPAVGAGSLPTGGMVGAVGDGCGVTSEPIGGAKSEPVVCPGVISEPMFGV